MDRQLDRVVLDRQLRRVEDTVQALNAKIADLSADLDDEVVTRFRRASSQLDRLNSLRNAVREGSESDMRDLARLAIAAFGREGTGSGVIGVDVQRIRRTLRDASR